jgi:arylsulfatase A-like enzyme
MNFKIIFLFSLLLMSLNISGQISVENYSEIPPNFILVLTDDQGWNGTSVSMSDNQPLSKSDYHQTPNFELLARKGMRFSSAYASAPVCSPSRYSIQFGQTPARLRMIRVGMNTDHIDHETPITIPKILKKINQNYKSAHFGKWGIDVDPSILGYDESDGITGNKDGGFDYRNNVRQWQNTTSEDPKKIFSLTQRAVEFIEKQALTNTPFFLQVSHYAVHSDIMMREETLEKYQALSKGARHLHAGFAAMTEDMDSGLGIILEKVNELGLEKNTYIIYTSDNGAVPVMPPRSKYKFSTNTPLSRGKWDALEGGIRVPFVIKGPKIKAGAECNVPISFSDILPTIIDIAGKTIPLHDELDGGSFKKVVFENGKGEVKRNEKGIVFHVPYENGIALKRAHSAIIQDNFKLIKFYDTNEVRLYSIENDVEEKHDLSQVLIEKTNLLETALDEYLTLVKAPKWKQGITWRNKSIDEINSFH